MPVFNVYVTPFLGILILASDAFCQEKKYEVKLDTISIRQMFDGPMVNGGSQIPNQIVFEETVSKAQGEKLFSVEVQWPFSLNPSKLSIYYYEGREVKHIQLQPQQQSVLIKDIFVSKFAGIQFFYPIDGSAGYHSCYFSIGEAPGKVKFASNDLSNPFSSFELTNVLKLDDIGYGEYRLFVGNQPDPLDNAILFPAEIRGKSFNYPVKASNLIQKQIAFIRTYGEAYYSVLLFRGLLNDSRLATHLLRKTFNESFPKTFKSSVEGTLILKELGNRK